MHDAKSYKRLNGVDKFDVVTEDIRMLPAIKGCRKPAVSVQMLDITSNKPFYQKFVKQWIPYLNANDSARARRARI
jgi:hypothetical protein